MIKRISLGIIALLLILCLVIGVTLVWILATESGLRSAWSLATRFVPNLEAEVIEGRLTGPLKLRGLRFTSDTIELQIDAADLEWPPGKLLQRHLLIEKLHVQGLRYTQLKPSPPEPDKEPFSLPESIDLPVRITLQDVSVQEVEYRPTPDADPFVIDSAKLAALFAESQLDIKTLTAQGPLFEVEGQGAIEAYGDYANAITLDWQARPPGFAPIDGATKLSGDLSELLLQQTLDAPYNVTLNANVLDALERLQLKAKLVISDTRLKAIGEELPDITLNATANAGGELDNLGYGLKADADIAEIGVLKLNANGGLENQLVNLEKILLTVAGTPTQLKAQGQIDLSGTAPELDIATNWEKLRWPLKGSDPLVKSPAGSITVNGSLDDLRAILQVQLHDDGMINGNIRREGDAIEIALNWKALSFPINNPQAGSPNGKFSLTGTLDKYTLQANASLELPQQTNGRLALAGAGSTENINLETIRLDVLEGQIVGRAAATWKPKVQGNVSLQGKNLNPGIVAPQWPGNLQFKVIGSADQENEKLVAELGKMSVTGRLRDRPFDLQAVGGLRNDVLQIRRFDMKSGSSTVTADGKIGETLAIDWKIDSPDLEAFLPNASGTLKGNGKVGGKLPWPSIKAAVNGTKIEYASYALENLKLNADVDLQSSNNSTLDLQVKNAKAAGVEVGQFSVKGNGTRHDHRLVLQADSSVGNANLDLTGDIKDEHWAVKLTDATLQYAELAPWTLAAPQPATVNASAQTLEKGCWRSSEAELCMQGMRDEKNLQAAVDIAALPFGYFNSLLPTDITLQGKVSGEAEVSQRTGEELALDLDLKTTASEIRTRDQEEQPGATVLAMEPATIKAKLGADGLSALLNLPVVDQGGIKGEVSIPAGSAPLAERQLSGDLNISLADIGFITALSPEVEEASGAIKGDITLAGTLQKPEPNGNVALSNGSLKLAAPGLNITDLGLQAQANSSGAVEFSGAATSGKGSLKISGDADLAGESMTTRLSVTGDSFQVFNTNDARVYVSPDLNIAVDATGIGISGELTIPRASITPKQLPPSAQSASGDQVIITAETESAEAAVQRELHAKVQVILGDKVKVDGFGFKGGVTGELTVVQEPGEPPTGSGELDIVDGEYRAYGQGLVVEKGKILFAGGPLSQPGVNVRAVRRPAEDILVGVQVRGSLQQPDFTVFSEPSMSQSEQLSWLVLGRSMEGSSDAESDLVTQAAMALGLKGGNFLADRFGGGLGVDNIGIETGSGEAGAASDVNQAAFVVGKYLSPKLYVSYGIGLFESISTVKLEYTVSDHWKVATESSTEASGGDVIYTIER